jgi:hypothetical protein
MPAIVAGGFLWKETDLRPRRVLATSEKNTALHLITRAYGQARQLAKTAGPSNPIETGPHIRTGTSG